MSQSTREQKWKLLILGTPLLVLVLASIAFTAFLSVNLISEGLQTLSYSRLILGMLLAAMWLYMFYRTLRDRISASMSSPDTITSKTTQK